MEIKLNSLILENFKGISYFELNVDGKNASVYGTNASGKQHLLTHILATVRKRQ